MTENSAPFFIVGSQRSGTTMLRLMMNQHSRLCVPFESAFIPEFYNRFQSHLADPRPEDLSTLLDEICGHPFVAKGGLIENRDSVLARKPTSYASLVDAIFCEYAKRNGKQRWGDKTPSYIEEMDVLWKLFPGCRFVHLVRDGRDVALSLRKISWGSRNLVKLARDWSWKVTLGRKMGAMIPANYLEIHYENLVTEPGKTLSEICRFLDEDFEEEMLDYHENAREKMPDESINWHRNSVKRPDSEKVAAWKEEMSVADQTIFDHVSGETLQLFGYERSVFRHSLRSKIRFARYVLLGRA